MARSSLTVETTGSQLAPTSNIDEGESGQDTIDALDTHSLVRAIVRTGAVGGIMERCSWEKTSSPG